MYTMIKLMTARQIVLEQLPVLTASLLFAEFFYKFHSFTLECVAFLTTWYALDTAVKFFQRVNNQDQ